MQLIVRNFLGHWRQLFLAALLWLILSASAWANEKSTGRVFPARVVHDGAQVYEAADFDSKVISYLLIGDKIDLLSPNVVGPFYEIRTVNGLHGFIADIDVKPLGPLHGTVNKDGRFRKNSKISDHSPEENVKGLRKKKHNNHYTYHILNGAFMGPELGYLEFREKASGEIQRQNMQFLGIKFIGKDLFVSGLLGELNFYFISAAPAFYQGITGYSPASGYMMSIDALMVSPLKQSSRFAVYGVFGPSIRYNRWQLLRKNTNGIVVSEVSSDFRPGLEFGASVGYLFGRNALRLDWRIFWEKVQNNSLGIALTFLF